MAEGFIKTKCSSGGRGLEEFDCVKFEMYRRKNEIKTEKLKTHETHTVKKGNNLNLKKVRHEVVKFGISGFDVTKREEAKIALAVSLGAKPPRREYINYKELMDRKKKEKMERAKISSLMQSGKDSMMNKQKIASRSGSAKKGSSGNLLNAYGKVKKQQSKRVHR